MTRISLAGDSPIYLPITFLGDNGFVYGLNVFPGEQSIHDNAWAAMQTESSAIVLIQRQILTQVAVAPLAAAVPPETVDKDVSKEQPAKSQDDAPPSSEEMDEISNVEQDKDS